MDGFIQPLYLSFKIKCNKQPNKMKLKGGNLREIAT